MAWTIEIPLITRVWINDLDANPTYSDARIKQIVVVAALNVNREVSFTEDYDVDVVNETISPDPCLDASLDNDFTALVALKAACILDQSTYRTKAVNEGVKAGLASATLSTKGNLKGYLDLLNVGPCAMYAQLRQEFEIGNPNMVEAVLSPFVGNDFDPSQLSSYYGYGFRNGPNQFYS